MSHDIPPFPSTTSTTALILLSAAIFLAFGLAGPESDSAGTFRWYLTLTVVTHSCAAVGLLGSRAVLRLLYATGARLPRSTARALERLLWSTHRYVAGFLNLAGIGVTLLAVAMVMLFGREALPFLAVGQVLIVSGVVLGQMTGALPLQYLRKCSAKSADEILASDGSPVLYLRSFQDDDEAEQISGWYLTDEEQVTLALSDLGPVIAVGEPGEVLPDLGAARFVLHEERWQEEVRHLVDRALLVVVRVATTPGLLWEVGVTVRCLEPKRLLLIVSEEPKQYRAFFEAANELFPSGLPSPAEIEASVGPSRRELRLAEAETSNEAERRRLSRKIYRKRFQGCVGGLVSFTEDWSPRFTSIDTTAHIAQTRLITLGLHRALRPVYAGLGRDWTDQHRFRWFQSLRPRMTDR